MNETSLDQPGDTGCVVDLVEWQARQTPDALAVVSSSGALTYRELNDRANAVADQLRAFGVGPEVVVGLHLPRSMAMIIGMLGVLKSGGAYLPLDPSDPAVRTGYMLEDAGAAILVTTQSWKEKGCDSRCSVLVLDALGQLVDSPFLVFPQQRGIDPKSLAYVIYTSGSTGMPKGVEVSHENLAHLVAWHRSAFRLTREDCTSHLARGAFDAAGWEIWPSLAAGACLHLPDDEQLSDPAALQSWLIDRRITISFVPTPMAERLLALPWPAQTGLRVMLTGGDTLHVHPPPGLPFVLVNNYGPTECTVVSTSGVVPANGLANQLPSIGRPISNTQIYILDESFRSAAAGCAGEIYIGGAGVARGYRHRPELTAERFVSNPLSGGTGRLFKTGDLAQFMPDGEIAFLGRADDQIKIRGFRIEPNEVVAALSQHQAIAQSVVVAREIAGERRLVAYVVLRSDPGVGPAELREFVGGRLPDYMVPAIFVKLEAMPLTPNGKVDRAALPMPDAANRLSEVNSRNTLTEVESIVASILEPLLGIEHVDVNANFFSLGGHSLLGIQLISRVRERLGVELPLRTVFDAPSVAELATEIERLLCAKVDAMSDEEVRRTLDLADKAPA